MRIVMHIDMDAFFAACEERYNPQFAGKPIVVGADRRVFRFRAIWYHGGMKKPRIAFRQSLFWDIDPKTIDPRKHARYIIERVLEFGNDREVSWLFSYYPPRLIRGVLDTSRGVLHEKTKELWSLVLR